MRLFITIEIPEDLKKRLSRLRVNIPQEERRFSAHITLARLKLAAPRECGIFLDRHRKLELPSFPVRDFRLFQSRLTPHSAEHIPLKTFPLKTRSREG